MDETLETAPAVAAALLDPLVEKYLALRQRKSELKAKYDADVAKLEDAMSRVESYFRGVMLSQGLTSLPTRAGTPYISHRTYVNIADKAAYKNWLMEDPERFDEYIDLKANKTAVDAYKEANNDIPPGLNYRQEMVVNVRKN